MVLDFASCVLSAELHDTSNQKNIKCAALTHMDTKFESARKFTMALAKIRKKLDFALLRCPSSR